MINWFLYFHTYFGWILIESGGRDGIGGKDRQGNNRGLKRKKKEEMCWRNGIWHLCVKIASPANTFAIISLVQRGVAQAALRPPYGARRQHLHEGWAGEGKLQLLWLSFLQGLLHYHNVVREREGCGVSWHLGCKGVSLHGPSIVTFCFLFFFLSFILYFKSLYDSFLRLCRCQPAFLHQCFNVW